MVFTQKPTPEILQRFPKSSVEKNFREKILRSFNITIYDLPYYFSMVLQATSASVYCNASVQTVSLRMRGASTFTSKWDIKHVPLPGRVTGI